MSLSKDYLRFDAFSIKKLIEQKLSENTDFTDFIYPSSDLSVFIDIVAYAFQILQYYINQGGSEAIAVNAQFYENINRIVKFLSYNPNGYTTSLADISVSGVPSELNNNIIPPYTTITLNDTDENGDPITFSTVDYYYLYDDSIISGNVLTNELPLYNGKWNLYESPFTAEGIPFETFTLDNLYSDTGNKSYVAFPFVHAFIKRGTEWFIFKPSPTNLFINTETQTVYNSTEQLFELRLNEFKQVEVKFGDGIYAELLQTGDVIYFVYLKSNGPDGEITAGDIENLPFKTDIKGFDRATLRSILVTEYNDLINDVSTLDIDTGIVANNYSNSSSPVEEETVDQIRENAPKHFRSGGRLLTDDDYEYFIRSRYYKDIIDVKVQNNWDYLKTFIRWLYLAGESIQNDAGYYLGNSLKYRYGYEWADSCDFNNIYIWMKMKTGFTVSQKEILRRIQSIKTLTGEVMFMDPVSVLFVPCAYDKGYDTNAWDEDYDNYIEIQLNTTTVESPQRIRSKANSIIMDYFAEKNQTLGSTVDFNDLHSRLLSIKGVNRIRTVYTSGNDTIVSINGLKFAKWSPTILDGADKELTNGTVKLENFMFPSLLETTMKNRIKVITDSAYRTNEVEY